jgi:SAM-dependent methyltransferase
MTSKPPERTGPGRGTPPIDPQAFKSFEHAGWVEVAAGYSETFSHLTDQAIGPLLDAARVGPGTRMLDVACGPGHLVAAAARRGARATGIDFSATMVEEARRRNPGIDFSEGDAEALAAPDDSFDAVVIAFGMLHFAQPDRALEEVHRVLRPGGRIAFTVWDLPERAATFGLVLKAVEAHGDLDVPLPPGPPFFRFSDPTESRRSCEAVGLGEVEVKTLPLAWRIESTDALLRIFMEGGVRTRALLRAQKPEAFEAIRAALRDFARPFERDGSLDLPTPAVMTSARRPGHGV